ncbi:MAG: hypothetical protein A3C08_00690 [Candidatus Taylorbacteria bacterium RIFCSPHIGHO2_02_FULL_47_18]|uniref:DUF5678 domain-containing protein n=1 Tax=Candidatus Taylorbacteria bacterium RIFCSPLOWO2_01_FULL_48_100 TaxID=1802322 RepID=A0A1G2NER2_9BACT|nr:MAG: hypothetical protein A2670_00590 [Candidatus Taylorbacteria bacterium RIFCSPHIGHO2_01_FULL_48_38]OHA27491.1 MAG: hypothetical protein A3C08_00690 [Candidatus Taylorbacteria bacterium RIFCSPHIGHO2_02_FULL_47_18]OHA34553.1 MAG: hypothetical protein A2938_03310 [Candidatus Taylorbacteria bacterium RIFCSPLOWO2_01_FULL_48_100]OHA40317.1 MAG: hypothetical protein A3J31_01785 [Candidatus Taylorbacteria bacterium RIFCSPLOWO2_02_FULL_48_16]OHA44977.1 MAG: hypothetical protein A3H13_03625 [Candid
METVKAPNLKVLNKTHENKWVAVSSDYKKVVAVDDTLRSLQQKVGEKESIIMRVLPSDVGYAPGCRA